MNLSICSFSFHRSLAAGKQDMFQYIKDCKMLGCTHLEPWNAHLSRIDQGQEVLHAGSNPQKSHHLTAMDDDYLDEVKRAADDVGLAFGCIAVDGAHIYEQNEEDRARNRAKAYRWIAIAERLSAAQIRIDSGGADEFDEQSFEIILEGYEDIIKRAAESGIQVVVENHWGPTRFPDNVVKLQEALPKLGLLLDSWNWAPGKQAEGWLKCAKYATATHIKSFHFTEDGQELTQNIPSFIRLLRENGFNGIWGIESVPAVLDELEGARRTVELIKRTLT